jgi:aminopeptidase-like protein
MSPDEPHEGRFMHDLATRLFPINRSITGDGVRETLAILGEHLPGLVVHEVPSGTAAFDWTVPDEWNITEAYLIGPDGSRVVDFADHNLHLVAYSTPVDVVLSLEELQEHLHSDTELPDAIPYVTSYYNRVWGFCLPHTQRQALIPGSYQAVIRGTLEPGSLTYGELLIPGDSDSEVFVTTYVCHPSLANNELSGPVVSVALARWLLSLPRRRYTYRFVFAPESIGALTYASINLEHLRTHVISGFNLTCIGDDGDYSYLASRLGDLEIDRIGRHVLSSRSPAVTYSYLDRGSDERTYCAPGIDLPMISLMRTRYGSYREYHTSLDDLTVITPTGLQGGLDLARECVEVLEVNDYYQTQVLGEAQLGRLGLYHAFHARTTADIIMLRTNVMAYADGHHSVLDMAILFGLPVADVFAVIEELVEHDLLVKLPSRKES